MIFDPLVKAWQDGDETVRAGATLELRNLSGSPLGWNRAGQETDLIAAGDGALHYFRRGDFGERGNKPPGLWRGACDPAEVETIWRALQGLTEKDFQGRAADPGEGVTQLQAQCGGRLAVLSWGPGELGQERPGVDALAPLRRLVTKAQTETVWTLRVTAGAAKRTRGGLILPLEFSNDGPQPVHFLLSPPGQGAEFLFRYAVDESDENGPPLQINWLDAEIRMPEVSSPRIASVEADGPIRLEAFVPVDLPIGARHLGQLTYSQLGLGERVAGLPVFAGLTFTGIFKLELPA